jgi:alpha/beta hydrolase family protein
MWPRKTKLSRYLLSAFAAVAAVMTVSSPSEAFVNQIVIDQTATVNVTPVILGTSTAGPSMSYTIYQGRIFGLLNPTISQNSGITDIGLASWSGFPAAGPSGQVQYIANFEIVTPTNPAQRSGLLIHEVPNRGGDTITLNGASLIAGATYVQSGWQGDLLSQCAGANPVPLYPCVNLGSGPYGALSNSGTFTPPSIGSSALAAYVVQVPVATTDGNPAPGYTGNVSNNVITGSVYSHICTGTNGCGIAVGTNTPTSVMQIQSAGGAGYEPYLPAGYLPSNPGGTLSTAGATFWSVPSQTFQGVEGTMTPISNWSWANCPSGPAGTPNPYYVCLASGNFNPNLLYEMTYTAQNPLVLGVGFAAFRDLASFLRYGTTAPGGGANPIAGSITKAYTVGASQSGAFIHGLVFYGFNQDESNHIVFDGAWPQIDGRMMVMNIRWGAPNDLMYLDRGGDEAPVWWADYPNLARNLPADGMLHRCNATTPNTCPQILETFASAEMYSEKMSVSLCGFTCVADIPLPANVYRYYSPGATHGGGTVSFNWAAPGVVESAGQVAPTSPIPETFTNNALQYAFIGLLGCNPTCGSASIPMPPSVAGVTYPSLASGQLVVDTASAEGFPTNVPSMPFSGNQAWPPFVYNFGAGENYDQESGIPTIQPPTISSVLPVYVPPVNADGNEIGGGVPSVLYQAPLATYVGWNLATTGWYGPGASNGPGSVGQVLRGRATAEPIIPSGTQWRIGWPTMIRGCRSRSGTGPMPATAASFSRQWSPPARSASCCRQTHKFC